MEQGLVWHSIGDFESFEDLAAAHDLVLSDSPHAPLRPLASDLGFVTVAHPPSGYMHAGLAGLATGVATAALIAVLFRVMGWVEPVVTLARFTMLAMACGGGIGLLLGVLARVVADQRSEFTTAYELEAGRYHLASTSAEVAERAARVLAAREGTTDGTP